MKKLIFLLIISVPLVIFISSHFPNCGRQSPSLILGDLDKDGIADSEDPDVDGDGIPNDQDPDDDNDGCPDINDPAPYNPSVGCDDGEKDSDNDGCPDIKDPAPNDPSIKCDPIDKKCKDDGEWVTVIDSGAVSQDLKNCLTTKSFDEEVTIKIYCCHDHRDAIIINGNTISVRSFALSLGDIGAFPGMHADCSKFSHDGVVLKDKALVYVRRSGEEEKKILWDHPAFTSLYLNIGNIDVNSGTRLIDIAQIEGSDWSKYQYSKANNGYGETHILTFNDTWSGAWMYGLQFTYQFDTVKEGYYY